MKGGTPMPEPRNSLNWDVTEGGHHEQWTRDDEGGKDEQKFIHCDSQQEIKVHYVGDKVYIERYKPGDLTFYHGTISINRRSISGRYLSASGAIREGSWHAQINY